MAVSYGRQHLPHVMLCVILSNDLLFDNPFEKLSTAAVFHNNVDEGLLDVDIMDAYDIGMVLKRLTKEILVS
jgi:hypothetical protein